MGIILHFAIVVLCATICKNIAIQKGYNHKWAMVWGILGAAIAVILYTCLPDKNNENKQ